MVASSSRPQTHHFQAGPRAGTVALALRPGMVDDEPLRVAGDSQGASVAEAPPSYRLSLDQSLRERSLSDRADPDCADRCSLGPQILVDVQRAGGSRKGNAAWLFTAKRL